MMKKAEKRRAVIRNGYLNSIRSSGINILRCKIEVTKGLDSAVFTGVTTRGKPRGIESKRD